MVVGSIAEVRRLLDAHRAAGRSIGFVPTMGYLHAGHQSLMQASVAANDITVVSIFVNPLQFATGEDLGSYPRDLARDTGCCVDAGVDLIFAPSVEEMYPEPMATVVDVASVAAPLEGASRPEHFAGVATVVAKLFSIMGECRAYFGEKDWQQVAVVARMAADLSMPVEVVPCPTMREPDGLAMSSRNVYLDAGMRSEALVLSRALALAETSVRHGERSREALLERVVKEIESAPHAAIDYVELRDPETLELALETLTGEAVLALAVHFPHSIGSEERVRLIDNRVLTIP